MRSRALALVNGIPEGRARLIIRDYLGGASQKQLVDGYSDISVEKITALLKANNVLVKPTPKQKGATQSHAKSSNSQ